MNSLVLCKHQIKDNGKPNPFWCQDPITVVIVGNRGLGSGMKVLEGKVKLHI